MSYCIPENLFLVSIVHFNMYLKGHPEETDVFIEVTFGFRLTMHRFYYKKGDHTDMFSPHRSALYNRFDCISFLCTTYDSRGALCFLVSIPN